jgi:hypothetical protein
MINNRRGLRSKLTLSQVEFIRAWYTGVRGQRIHVMRKYGITSRHFYNIIKGRSWK